MRVQSEQHRNTLPRSFRKKGRVTRTGSIGKLQKRLAPGVWKRVADTVIAKCEEWNVVAGERTFTYRETMLGDLRILCAGRSQQMVVHHDSQKIIDRDQEYGPSGT